MNSAWTQGKKSLTELAELGVRAPLAEDLRVSTDFLEQTTEHYNAATETTQYKSSAVAQMGDCGHNRHGLKRGEGLQCPFRRGGGSWIPV